MNIITQPRAGNDLEDLAFKSTEKGTIETQGTEAAPPPDVLRDQIRILQITNNSIVAQKLNYILATFKHASKIKYFQISKNKNSLKSGTI